MIANSERFAAEVLPQYFNHSNWTSFLRQLSAYQFKRVTINDTPAYEQREGFFQRGRPDLMAFVKRRKDKRRSTDSADAPTPATASNSSSHSGAPTTTTTATTTPTTSQLLLQRSSSADNDDDDDDDDGDGHPPAHHRLRRRRVDSPADVPLVGAPLVTPIPHAVAPVLPLALPSLVPVHIRAAAHDYDKILINFSANITSDQLLGIERDFGKVITGLMHASSTPSITGTGANIIDELPDQQLVNELSLANSVRLAPIDADGATHA